MFSISAMARAASSATVFTTAGTSASPPCGRHASGAHRQSARTRRGQLRVPLPAGSPLGTDGGCQFVQRGLVHVAARLVFAGRIRSMESVVRRSSATVLVARSASRPRPSPLSLAMLSDRWSCGCGFEAGSQFLCQREIGLCATGIAVVHQPGRP
jgi:hypothetical protein